MSKNITIKPRPIEVGVCVSNTLSRYATIEVEDYEELEPTTKEFDDGYLILLPNISVANSDLKGAFNKKCFTLKGLLDTLSGVTADINQNGLTEENLRTLNRLAAEGKCWQVDEEEVVKN